ncbi:hypothetical protein OQA88_6946 [Cercophora sp. LCS_1]
MSTPSPPGQSPPTGPSPYLPQVAQLGGRPTPIPDDPISAVLLALFVGSAVLHMAIFQINMRRSHKFIFSVLLFGFSMARITALSMRMAWASHPTNVNVAIAAGVMTAAGVLLLFLVNLMFAQRVVRAYFPKFGWSNAVRWVFRVLFGSVVGVLIMVVTVSVHLFFTADPDVRAREREVQLFAGVYLAVLAFLPVLIVAVVKLVARSRKVEDKFGTGKFRVKVGLLVGTSLLLTLGAAFRAGIAFVPRPITQPAWYHSRAAYYIFNFGVELLVVYAYGLARFDRRFHVPDGSKGPGDYKGVTVNNEEEVFGPADGDDTSATAHPEDEGVGGVEWEERFAYSRRKSEAMEEKKEERKECV